MTIQFGGIVSQLPVNDIIDQLIAIERRPINFMEAQKTELNSKQSKMDDLSTRTKTLLDSLRKLTQDTFSNPDIFSLKSSSSTNENKATASVTKDAAQQTFTLRVHALASSTKAASVTPSANVINAGTALSDIAGVTDGDITYYVNGVANTFTIDTATQTVGDVLTAIQGNANINTATVNAEGKIEVEFNDTNTVQFGASGDVSNFLKVVGLSTGIVDNPGPGSERITSSKPNVLIDLGGLIETNDVNLQTAVAGGSTFKIGNATFDVTGKTMNQIIAEINSSADANASLSFNQATNTFSLISKETGSTYMTLEDTSGNFLEAIGLISGGDTTASQTLGNDAQFEVNGGMLFSETNTVDSTITGLTGVTLNLLQADAGAEEVTITVGRDDEALKEGFDSFITDFNALMSFIDTETINGESQTGALANDSTVRTLKNKLRAITSKMVGANTTYTSLPSVGISTGAVGSSAGTAQTTLSFTFEDLIAALDTDSSEVYDLIKGPNGVLSDLDTYLDGALNDSDGLFLARKDRTAKQIADIDDSIERAEIRIEAKEKLLRQQFTAMESAIARFQSQGNALSSLAARLGQ